MGEVSGYAHSVTFDLDALPEECRKRAAARKTFICATMPGIMAQLLRSHSTKGFMLGEDQSR